MLTLLGVALLEIFLYILRPGAGADLPDTAVALLYIGWALVILRAAWWELSRGAGFVHHLAYVLAVMWLHQLIPAHLMALRPVYAFNDMPDLLAYLLVAVMAVFLPYGIMAPPLLEGWRLVTRRWRPW